MSTFCEHDLQAAYAYSSRFPCALTAQDGRPIKIVERGRLNLDNGPDILDALIDIDGIRCRGDIEIHLRWEDWFRHGHHEDRRYRQVILHLVWHPLDGISDNLARRMPQVCLQQALPPAVDIRRMAAAVAPPHDAPLPDLARLAGLALQRFNRRQLRYREWLRQFSPDDVLWISLAEVMGYAKNSSPFRQLFWHYPPSLLRQWAPGAFHSPASLWSLLVYLAGLAATDHRPSAHFCNHLLPPHQRREDWYFSRLRPHNQPILRMAAIAQLLSRYQHHSLLQHLLEIAHQRQAPHRTLGAWRTILRQPMDSALTQALRQSCGYRLLPAAIVGEDRFRQFIINALLPLFSCLTIVTGNSGLTDYFLSLYEQFPACERTRIIANGSTAAHRKIRRSGFYQQGVLEWRKTG